MCGVPGTRRRTRTERPEFAEEIAILPKRLIPPNDPTAKQNGLPSRRDSLRNRLLRKYLQAPVKALQSRYRSTRRLPPVSSRRPRLQRQKDLISWVIGVPRPCGEHAACEPQQPPRL